MIHNELKNYMLYYGVCFNCAQIIIDNQKTDIFIL